jgi:hypothetical protein
MRTDHDHRMYFKFVKTNIYHEEIELKIFKKTHKFYFYTYFMGCSDLQAFVNTIKSFVGVGILEFPYAVKSSGLWVCKKEKRKEKKREERREKREERREKREERREKIEDRR